MKIFVLFIFFLSSPSRITKKLQGVYKCSTYQTTPILLEMFLFWFGGGCDLWWRATTPNMHHSHCCTHDFVRISSIPQKLWPPRVYQPVACKSKVVGKNVGVVYLWLCQEVAVAMYKTFAFFFGLTYMTTFPDDTFWEHVIYDWWATTPNTVGREIFAVSKFSQFSQLWSNREIKNREI